MSESNGTANVQLSMKPSKNYNSVGFSVGLSLPIGPKEKPQKAMQRVFKEVEKFMTSHAGKALSGVEVELAKYFKGV